MSFIGEIFTKKPVMVALFAVLLGGCVEDSQTTFLDTSPMVLSNDAFDFRLPENIPRPIEPIDNLATEGKFELGRHLFYDLRLSGNGTQSCASCHQQDKAFSDGVALPMGSTGEVLARNSQTLVNTAFNSTLTWANPTIIRLEQQLLIPLFGEFPVEQGITEENKEEVLAEIASDEVYQQLFFDVYGNSGEAFNYENIVDTIAVFVRGLISFNSPFDRFQQGDATAMSEAAMRGKNLFFSENLECFHCHGGYNFSESTADVSMRFIDKPFHNTGLFNIDGNGAYPPDNTGIMDITGEPEDMGKFRAPSLRNIELSAPYMHDGSVSSLEEVIRIYAAGGRNITSGEFSGDGRENPFKDGFISGFEITDEEVSDLIEFLHSLTDVEFVTNPRFSNPWEEL